MSGAGDRVPAASAGRADVLLLDVAVVVAGLPLEELDFTEGASVALIVRGDRLIPPKLQGGKAVGR